jgi:hypothetical protein
MIHRMSDIHKLSDEELEQLLNEGELEQRGHQLAFEEYSRRKLSAISKPHWTLTPGFVVGIGALLVSGLAAYFAYLAIPHDQRPFGSDQQSTTKTAAEQKQQNPSTEVSLPKTKSAVPLNPSHGNSKSNPPSGADAKNAAH